MERLQVIIIACGAVTILMFVWLHFLSKEKKSDKKSGGISLGKKIAKCGHETKIKGKVTAFGHTTTTKMPVNEDGSLDYCLDCIGKMTIRCAWCKEPIFIGDIITLYSPMKKDEFVLPEDAVIYNEERMTVVGCGRITCADTGADYAGSWLPGENGKGKVHRRPTMIEQSMVDLAKGGNGVIIQNR